MFSTHGNTIIHWHANSNTQLINQERIGFKLYPVYVHASNMDASPRLSPSRPLSGLNPNKRQKQIQQFPKTQHEKQNKKRTLNYFNHWFVLNILPREENRKRAREMETKSNRREERIIHHQWLFKVGKEGEEGVFRHNRS